MSRCIQSHGVLGRVMRRPQSHFPVLHFLSDTATLHRFYSDSRSAEVDSQDGNPFANQARRDSYSHRTSDQYADRRDSGTRGTRRTPSRGSYATHRTNGTDDPDRRPRFRSEAQADSFSRRRRYPENDSIRPFDKDATTNPWTGRPTKSTARGKSSDHVEHVPFDSPGDSGKQEISATSTLSDEEKKAFDRLRKLGSGVLKPSKVGNQMTSNNPQTVEEILEEAMSNIEAERDVKESVPKRDMALIHMRRTEVKRISDLLKGASSDIVLWSLLEKEVFGPIAALNLDDPTDDRLTEREKRKPGEKVRATDTDVIMHNFPILLTSACRTLRALFPSSSLVYAVVPKVRDMGPSAYALGASTKLYNQIIAHTFNKLTDVDRVNELLEEMEREVIEPDAVTLVLLDNIMTTWQKVRRGMYGEAARVTWETDRIRKSLVALGNSKSQIEATVSTSESSRAAREHKASL